MNSENSEQPPDFRIPKQQPVNAADDNKAESEAAAFAFDLDLESGETERKLRKLANKNALDGTITSAIRLLIWFAIGLILISFTILFYHYLAPSRWLFLETDRIQSLKEMLLSGALGAGISVLWQSQMRDK